MVVARPNRDVGQRRVTVISHEASRTGAPRVAISLLSALRANGWSTTVLHRHGGPLRAALDEAADTTRNESLWRVRGQLRRARLARAASSLEMAAARHELKRHRPDLVWANTVVSVPYVLAACDLGIPVVWYAHEQPDHVVSVVGRFRGLGPLRGALLAGCSPEAVGALERGVGAPEGSVRLLTPPVDTKAIRRRAAEFRRTRLASEGVTVVAVGTGDHRKGVDVFSRAAERSQDSGNPTRWRWVGRPPTERSAAVDWVGEVADPLPEMVNASIVVVPSRAEGYPLVVMEAMAAASPVVATDLPGIRKQVGTSGLLIPPDDVEALLRGVQALVDDDGLRRRLGAAAQERSSRFDVGPFRRHVAMISDDACLSDDGR